MKLTMYDLDRLEKRIKRNEAVCDEQIGALFLLARQAIQQRDRYRPVAIQESGKWREINCTCGCTPCECPF